MVFTAPVHVKNRHKKLANVVCNAGMTMKLATLADFWIWLLSSPRRMLQLEELRSLY